MDKYNNGSSEIGNNVSLQDENLKLKQEVEKLKEDMQDLEFLYEGSIEHGVAVEDQLADKNAVLEKTQNRLKKELSEAANYIKSLLPEVMNGAVKTHWKFIPSTELGGDSFGYHWIDKDHLAIYLIDVCGHGVGAALLSATAINSLRSNSLFESGQTKDAGTVLTYLNKNFQMEKHNGMYFTIWYGIYSPSTRTLNYSSGGHPPSFLISYENGIPKLTQLMTKQIILGFMPDYEYQSQSCVVPPNSSLYVFELTKPDGQLLSFLEFINLFNDLHESPEVDLEHLVQQLKDIQKKDNFDDDFSLVRVDL